LHWPNSRLSGWVAAGRSTHFCRHELNLRSDILHPDIYWYRQDLETVYDDVTRHFAVRARVAALNDQLDYVTHTLNTLDGLLAHRLSTRLEWIIIVLIAIEVAIELGRWAGEHYGRQQLNAPQSVHTPVAVQE
jgi:uncharacterized Rmd1/YagE family protein